MSTNIDTPTFNLRAVVQETGLKADTLRAWERRYGLPLPERSAGGHRLYSRRDIEILKWLVSRIDEGLSISRAVELWRHLEREGEDPIADQLSISVGQIQPAINAGSSLDEIRAAWMKAGLLFDEQAADTVIAQAFAIFPVETVIHQIMRKAMSEVGEKWFSGDISVQQEHFLSQLTFKRVEALHAAAPPPSRAEKIIIACPSGEEHTIAMALLSLTLRRMGFQVYYFGANTPVEELQIAVSEINPNLMISAAQRLTTCSSLLTLATSLSGGRIQFAYGGRIFNLNPDLQGKFPGSFLGETLELSIDQIENILKTSLPLEPLPPIAKSFDEAHSLLQDYHGEISSRVTRDLSTCAIPQSWSAYTINHLNECILSSLRFEDSKYLSYEIDWLDRLLDHRQDEPNALETILKKYIHVAEEILNGRDTIVVDWLKLHLIGDITRRNT